MPLDLLTSGDAAQQPDQGDFQGTLFDGQAFPTFFQLNPDARITLCSSHTKFAEKTVNTKLLQSDQHAATKPDKGSVKYCTMQKISKTLIKVTAELTYSTIPVEWTN